MKRSVVIVLLAAVVAIAIAVVVLLPYLRHPAKETLTLQLKWVTQAQFAGYYVAKDKGFYDEVGLDVTIKPGGPDINPSQVIAGGGADVVLDWMPSALATREKGVPLVNIAQPFQKSGMELTCRKETGITKPEDFKGKTLGVWFAGELTEIYGSFFRFPLLELAVGPKLIGFAVVISAGAACLGALSAVRRAVLLPPAEAMRPEPPPRFGPGMVEQLGLQRFFSPPTKMILRNLGRRRLKAVLSMLGIALAVAILLLSRYFYDVIETMISVQFETAQREDVTVIFNDPRSSRVRSSLSHMPGVVRSEPFRLVPARLRSEHRMRRLEIIGISPGSELRRVVHQDLRVVDIPTEGLVLTDKLAEILGVSPGDKVTVEVLEGERPIRQVKVAATVDELIGVSAYMDIRALNRMMREGATVSGAYLAVERDKRENLYAFLKRTPAVGGVAVRESMVESFKNTIAESMTKSTSICLHHRLRHGI